MKKRVIVAMCMLAVILVGCSTGGVQIKVLDRHVVGDVEAVSAYVTNWEDTEEALQQLKKFGDNFKTSASQLGIIFWDSKEHAISANSSEIFNVDHTSEHVIAAYVRLDDGTSDILTSRTIVSVNQKEDKDKGEDKDKEEDKKDDVQIDETDINSKNLKTAKKLKDTITITATEKGLIFTFSNFQVTSSVSYSNIPMTVLNADVVIENTSTEDFPVSNCIFGLEHNQYYEIWDIQPQFDNTVVPAGAKVRGKIMTNNSHAADYRYVAIDFKNTFDLEKLNLVVFVYSTEGFKRAGTVPLVKDAQWLLNEKPIITATVGILYESFDFNTLERFSTTVPLDVEIYDAYIKQLPDDENNLLIVDVKITNTRPDINIQPIFYKDLSVIDNEGFSYVADHYIRTTDYEVMTNLYEWQEVRNKPDTWKELGIVRHVVAFKVPKGKQVHDFYLRINNQNIQL